MYTVTVPSRKWVGYHKIGLVPVVLDLGDSDGSVEIVFGKGWVQDFVAVVL